MILSIQHRNMEGITAIRRYKKAIFFCISIVVTCLVSTAKSLPRNEPCCGLLPNVDNGQWELIDGSDIAILLCDIGYCVYPEDLVCATTQCRPDGQWSSPGQEAKCLQTSNLALNYVSVVQISTNHGGVAELAVDGNRATSLSSYGNYLSCTHTLSSDVNPWWEVTLNGIYPIGRIVMTNRLSTDIVVPERLANLKIFVCTGVNCTLCATFDGPGSPTVSQITVTCDTIISGDTVRIEKTATVQPALTLCEVEIYTFQSRCNGLM